MGHRQRIQIVACILAVAVTTGTPDTALAWNPFKSVVKTVKKVGGFVGGVIGAPVGGFVGAATSPTIRNAEASAMRVTADLDDRMKARINQMDEAMGKRIAQMDASMRDRILQLDDAAKQRIVQVDEVLKNRTNQLNLVLTTAINDVDRSLKQRIEQLDQVAETRIGNLDVVASKASLSFEQSFIRVIGAGCVLVFVSVVIWRVSRKVTEYWAIHGGPVALANSLGGVAKTKNLRNTLFAEAGVAAAGLAVLYCVVYFMPGGARARQRELSAVYVSAFDRAYTSFDLDRARFLAAQLQAIEPTNERNRARLLKAELVRDVFSRPGLVQTMEGLNELSSRISQIDTYARGDDADVPALKAYIQWQVAADRQDELDAVKLVAIAIEAGSRNNFEGFLLLPVVSPYITAFVSAPTPGLAKADLDRFASLATKAEQHLRTAGQEQFAALAHAWVFNAASQRLDTAISQPYVDMLQAHAEVVRLRGKAESAAAQKQEKDKRTQWAKEIIAAWGAFDREMETNAFLRGTTSPLASFGLNDAVLATAKWFEATPDTDKLPPLLANGAADVRAGSESEFAALPAPADRPKLAPARIAWRDKYQDMLGGVATDIVDAEESDRFRRFEQATRLMEYDLVQYWTADQANSYLVRDRGNAAVLSAAALGWYVPTKPGEPNQVAPISRTPLAQVLLNGLVQKLSPVVQQEFEANTGESGKKAVESKIKDKLDQRRDCII